jgi:Ca2+-binding RTX toxin-like protein
MGSNTRVTQLDPQISVVVGGPGNDTYILAPRGQPTTVYGVETLLGSGVEDVVVLGNGKDLTGFPFSNPGSGATIAVSAVDILVGSPGTDVVTLLDGGKPFIYRGIETLFGSAAADLVVTGDTGVTTTIGAIEILVGGAGTDVITLGNGGNTLLTRGIETLTGGDGQDLVVMGDTSNAMTLKDGIEILVGGAGTDIITLGNNGNTLLTRGLETLIGGSSTDVVVLGDTQNTLTIQKNVEFLVGGAGTDIVTLGNDSNSLVLRGVETLIGGNNTDIVTIGNTGTTMTASRIETLVGGAGKDVVTIAGNAPVTYVTGAGHNTTLTLANGNASDRIVFETVSGTGGVSPSEQGRFDTVIGFQGTDKIVISGALTTAFGNNKTVTAINVAGTDLADFRKISDLVPGAPRGDSILVVSNGQDTGVYDVINYGGGASLRMIDQAAVPMALLKGVGSLSPSAVVFTP